MRTVLQKKWRHCVDDRFAQCSLLGPSSTALDYISIATEVCSLLLSVKWFFMTLNMKEKPCVCALCSITVTSSGVVTVLELKATAGWGLLHEAPTRSSSLLLLMEIQVNHLIQTSRGTGRPTSFPASLLEFYFFRRVLCPFAIDMNPVTLCLCWLACEGSITWTS